MTVVTSMYLYSLTITNFGKVERLQDMPWTLDFSFFIGGVISAVVQVCPERLDLYSTHHHIMASHSSHIGFT